MGAHDPLVSGIVRDAAKYHLRFSTELAAVVRVNLQRWFPAMTPISRWICGRQQLAAALCQRAVQTRIISPCVVLEVRDPMAGHANIAERRAGSEVLAVDGQLGKVDWWSRRGACKRGQGSRATPAMQRQILSCEVGGALDRTVLRCGSAVMLNLDLWNYLDSGALTYWLKPEAALMIVTCAEGDLLA